MAGGGRISKSAKRKQVITREKIKFKTKIRGNKVKWNKRWEEQNMRSEINYNVKHSALGGPKLEG